MENINNCFIDQGINFSPDFIIDFNKRDRILSIKKREQEIDFFKGSNVNQINLIVGKNGSGKSTILNLLGLSHIDREELLRNSPSWNWFAVYSNGNAEFILEGHNPNFIRNLEFNDVVRQNENDFYCLKIKRDNENFKFIGSRDVDRRETLYMYHANNLKDEWYPTHLFKEHTLGNSGYSREYIFSPKMTDIYELLTDQETLSRDTFSGNNIKLVISKRNILSTYDSEKYSYDLIQKFKDKIYSYKQKKEVIQQTENTVYSYQEKFVIEFLEDALFYILIEGVNSGYKEAVNILDQASYNNIKSNHFESTESHFIESDYTEKKKYLLNILESNQLNNFSKKPLFESYNYRELISRLEKVNSDLFNDQSQIIQDLSTQNRETSLTNLISFFEITKSSREFFPIKIEYANLSSGEFQYIKHYSNLRQSLDLDEKYAAVNNVILLLDEPDANFHPEWSRRYIQNLINTLESQKNMNFQIIITTHSPFMVSDIPSDYISCIDIVEKDDDSHRKINIADFGLMSNYYDLIKHNFFMEQPIGEYASNVFKRIINNIDKLKNSHIKFDKADLSKEIKSIFNAIDLIDDPIIRRKLSNYLEESIVNLRKEEFLKEKIERLKNEIIDYEKELNND